MASLSPNVSEKRVPLTPRGGVINAVNPTPTHCIDRHTAFIALGSNVDKERHMADGIRHLQRAMHVELVSPIYETSPVGYTSQDHFWNAVVRIKTQLEPGALLAALQAIEYQAGKATPFPNGPRTLDLDLLLYDADTIRSPTLEIPHPRMHERQFVLKPLADIAATLEIPQQKATVEQLLGRIENSGEQIRQVEPRISFR
jgi:2-amino-4-hydroxy-6-hydroxymethyldihydropteridine diphosphokinase